MTTALTPTRAWVAGARPRTLPAAVVPVLVGTVSVPAWADVVAWRVVAALAVSLLLQIAVNLANDYSDGVRGTDGDERVGPLRLVGSGLKTPAAVKRAAFGCFALAAVIGLGLSLVVGPELIVVGAASIAAAWFYTGGRRPYGYLGLGEVFVFVFFGLVATVGSAYVHTDRIEPLALAAAVPVGLLITAILVVNNLRDRRGDAAAGKRTLAVRLGDRGTRRLYVVLVGVAFSWTVPIAFDRPTALAALAGIPAAVGPLREVLSGADGPALIPVLGGTARVVLVHGAFLAIGLAIGLG